MTRANARLRLEDATTAIRPTSLDDCDEQLRLRRANRAHTQPWDPTRDESFYTVAGQRLELELDQRAWAAGTAFAFAVLATDEDDRIIGRVALANVVRGPWQNATLGYWIDKDAIGRGHASRAVRLALGYAFEPWDLPSAAEPVPDALPRRCPECGAPCPERATECPACGTELGGPDAEAAATSSAPG